MVTEKRLIYLEDAIAKIVDTPSAIAERLSNCEYGYYQNPDVLVDRQHEIIDLLMDVPAVEVVRCKDCNKSNDDVWPVGKIWCTKMCRYMDRDGFCSFGEERQ